MNELISEDYRREQAALHSKGNYGTAGSYYGRAVTELVRVLDVSSVLDYGCGSKQSLRTTLKLPPGAVYEGYDPAVPEFAEEPIPAELVCCIDVLEHIEPDLIDNVIDHLASLCDPWGFFSIQSTPAGKTLSDGRNAHLIQQGPKWWLPRLQRHFKVVARAGVPMGFAVLVKLHDSDVATPAGVVGVMEMLAAPDSDVVRKHEKPRDAAAAAAVSGSASTLPAANDSASVSPPPAARAAPAAPAAPAETAAAPASADRPSMAARIQYRGVEMIFHTPNEITVWRVRTLAQKEPDTIRWLESMPKGAVLLDVGANVGMYSIFAAKVREAKVYAFEPEAQNYAILNANIAENALSSRVLAFPVALSDQLKLDKLYLSDLTPGGSCHSFGAEVGFDLKPRPAAFEQGSVSMTIDHLVESGALPVPEYIKLDVDGFEHKVLQGAARTLANPRVRSIIVELNTHLKEHAGAIEQLRALGFRYDEVQAKGALRKDGAFEGVGEFIFTRDAKTPADVNFDQTYRFTLPRRASGRHVLSHLLNRVAKTPVVNDPFPYLVVDDVFPSDYYRQMLEHFPTHESLRPISETGRVSQGLYEERLTVLFTDDEFARMTPAQQAFWRDFAAWMYTDQFTAAFVAKFGDALEPRLANILAVDNALQIRGDALLVNDQTRYAIGPHTDAPHRLVSFLFYLPADDAMRDLGTSLYRHKDPNFVCWGGPHHPFDDFVRVKTIDFLPNRLVAFPKTERSFHGVERIEREGVNRPLLINNIRLLNKTTH
ncbi:MAG TPA: FkbM family methyltransferase [Ramlibacter sp.]|uniref:FkbM family methyltransferase n=1 Tax=Ramlibacter sp. TaxID=1917967 RepID=UPI002C21FACC|nr:FkbM family methyltransferase [Ramlibacter sp.]HVZ47058.1 FkbM family methyltransferase [Ramlibacter sp.]